LKDFWACAGTVAKIYVDWFNRFQAKQDDASLRPLEQKFTHATYSKITFFKPNK